MNRPPPKSTPFPYPALFRSTETVAAVVPKCHRLHGRLQLLVVLQGLDKCGNLLLDVVVLLVGDEVGDLKHLLLSLRSEEHTSELQSQSNIVCRLLLEKKKFQLLLSLLLPSLLIMFIPSTFKRPVSSWKALNLRKTLLMASSVRLKPLNCSRLPCVYAQETLTFLLTQKKTCVKNYVQKEFFFL